MKTRSLIVAVFIATAAGALAQEPGEKCGTVPLQIKMAEIKLQALTLKLDLKPDPVVDPHQP